MLTYYQCKFVDAYGVTVIGQGKYPEEAISNFRLACQGRPGPVNSTPVPQAKRHLINEK